MGILYTLQHLGYTIPPQADVGWIGEADPGPSAVSSNPFCNGVILSGAKRSRKISQNGAKTLGSKRFFGRLAAPSEWRVLHDRKRTS